MAPIVAKDDWAVYTRRGPWLLVAWGLALSFTFGLPALVRPRWDDVLSLFPEDGAWYGLPRGAWVFVLGAWSMNAGLTVLGNLVFLVVYWLNHPFFEEYKTNVDQPWPWNSPHKAIRDDFWHALPRSALRVVVNNLLILPALVSTYSLWAPFGLFGSRAEDFPSAWTFVWHIAVSCVVEDTMFYWCHRTLHNPRIFKYVHKIHHEYHHPIALASEHAHPIEFFVGNLVPVIAGPMLLKSHCFTIWCWILVRIFVSIDEHCGYTFPWSPVRLLPWGATVDGHDYHHNVDKDAIFASQFTWWDALCDTEGTFHEWRRHVLAGEGKMQGVQGQAQVVDGYGDGGKKGEKGEGMEEKAPAEAKAAASGGGRRGKKKD
jgi:sterol desaturase/sphingolipid hydroxylase (fatty acid hydroxylase superfamily)